MEIQVLSNFLLALTLTIIVEVLIAFFFGFRSKNEILIIILVNIITNPLLNYLLLLSNYFVLFKTKLPLIIFLELVVVLVEWRILFYVLKEKTNKLLMLSFLMNLSSFCLGLIIY